MSILKRFLQQLQEHSLLQKTTLPNLLTSPLEIFYMADTAHLPYGNKSSEFLQERAQKIIDFFISKQVFTIVIACHTLEAHAFSLLQAQYPKLSFINFLPSTIQKAVQASATAKIGIMATESTIKKGIHRQLLLSYNKNLQIYPQACPNLVPLIEQNLTSIALQQAVQVYVKPLLDQHVDTIILGCTHYEFARPYLQTYAPTVQFISAAQEDILRLLLTQHALDTSSTLLTFYSTAPTHHTSFSLTTLLQNPKATEQLELKNVSL